MNIHVNTELQRQHEVAKAAHDRLTGQVVSLKKYSAVKAKVANLEDLFRRQAQENVKLRTRNNLLQEQLMEAQGRIISQEQRICALSDLKETPQENRRPIAAICEEILKDFSGTSWDDIVSERRTREVIVPRHLCYLAVCAERTDLPIAQIARAFKRDHSTILHLLKKHGMTRKDTAK